MLSKVYSAGLFGVDGFEVTVECSAWDRLGEFSLVGLPDAAVKEAKDRVRCACENSGFSFPRMEIMVNLAPAHVKKEGSAFDLAILCSILQSEGSLPHTLDLSAYTMIGELSLSGAVRPVEGVLCLCLAAREAGRKKVVVPLQNVQEASVVEGIEVYGVSTFRELFAHLTGRVRLAPAYYEKEDFYTQSRTYAVDMADVRGQFVAKRAMEVAASGGHHMLLVGPPGSGKSMLAKRLPTVLPPLSFEEALESSRIHSVMGLLNRSILSERPFRSPHHTVSAVGMVGGGVYPRPGEISLSHNGVLFLDELPEFPKSVTEALRQPLEDGKVSVIRAAARLTFPSRFMMVCAMNPCRCGFYGDGTDRCKCAEKEVRRYLDRISGPLLDRIDIQVEMPAVTYDEMTSATRDGESSAAVRARVQQTRAYTKARFEAAGDSAPGNAAMTAAQIRRHCVLDDRAAALLKGAFESMGLSARGHDRILRVARTVADMDRSEVISAAHIAEAIQYRSLDRKYWRR